jgi:flagellar basal body rod protein FlgG
MDGIAWATQAMKAAQLRLDVAAANLANGSTDGFRRSRVRGRVGAAGIVMSVTPDGTPGVLRRTGRDEDLALRGPGAFRVRDPRGTVVCTRNGGFRRDRFDRLVDDRGRVLLGARGPLRFPPGATISLDGSVVAGKRTIDRLPLAAGSSVQSGFLESSDVDTIGEMIDVLTAQRGFETAQKVLSAIDSSRQRAASSVGALK